MARIRTVKPDFFQHEELQDLEAHNPGSYVMLVYEALWTQCDKLGRFEWKPRKLKLFILPYLPFEMETTLDILLNAHFIYQYETNGKLYGWVPTFTEHQRINGKEKDAPALYPDPPEEVTREVYQTHRGSTGEAPGKHPRTQEGKGKEGNEERKDTEEIERFSSFREEKLLDVCGKVDNSPQTADEALLSGQRRLVEKRIEKGIEPEKQSASVVLFPSPINAGVG